MRLPVERCHVVAALARAFPELAFLRDQLRFGNVIGLSLGEMLLDKSWLKETPALLQAYDASAARYFEWRGRCGEQFSAAGTGFFAEGPTISHPPRYRLGAQGCRGAVEQRRGRPAGERRSTLPPRTASLEAGGEILGA